MHDITISEPHYLLFYSADCKYTAATRQHLEMPHFSIVTKRLATQRLTCGKSVLRLFDILGGVHCKLENYGFHKQNFDYFTETINKAKRNVFMSDNYQCLITNTEKYNNEKLLLTSRFSWRAREQNFDYLRFQVYQTINRAKVNVSMSDINV